MAQFSPNADPANLLIDSMPIMDQETVIYQGPNMNHGVVMNRGPNINDGIGMMQGLTLDQVSIALSFSATSSSSLPTSTHIDTPSASPQAVHTMAMSPHTVGAMDTMDNMDNMDNMDTMETMDTMDTEYAQATFPSAVFHSRNSPGTNNNQQPSQLMASAIPVAGSGTANRMNTSMSSVGTNQTDMSGANVFSDTEAFGTRLGSPYRTYGGISMARNDSSGTEYSGIVPGTNMARQPSAGVAPITRESLRADYPEYQAYVAERERQALRNTGNTAPKRPRRPRTTNQSDEAKEIRKKQNRDAQRNYRDRREAELQNARHTLEDLLGRHSDALNNINTLIERLNSANSQIKALERQLAIGGSLHRLA